MRITLTRGNNLSMPKGYSLNWYDSIDLCGSGLRLEVELPEDIDAIDLVFTKTDGGSDSFEIDQNGFLPEVTQYILSETREEFRRLYSRGYRYVRVEYEAIN